jgi:hypothetical protein
MNIIDIINKDLPGFSGICIREGDVEIEKVRKFNPTCRNHNINHCKSGSCNLFFIFRVTQYYFLHRVDFYNLML